jgi:hypothetical protein
VFPGAEFDLSWIGGDSDFVMKPRQNQGARWIALLNAIADRADEIALGAFRADDLQPSASPVHPVTRADRGSKSRPRSRRLEPELGSSVKNQ